MSRHDKGFLTHTTLRNPTKAALLWWDCNSIRKRLSINLARVRIKVDKVRRFKRAMWEKCISTIQFWRSTYVNWTQESAKMSEKYYNRKIERGSKLALKVNGHVICDIDCTVAEKLQERDTLTFTYGTLRLLEEILEFNVKTTNSKGSEGRREE